MEDFDHRKSRFTPWIGDALILVDVQNDFLPGGALGVPDGDKVVPLLNEYVHRFSRRGLPIFATRDWHPADHCSFRAAGGPWPPHCIAETSGAQFAPGLQLPANVHVISKATAPSPDRYSGFGGTDLALQLHRADIRRVFVGGLATDYCVFQTVMDALDLGFDAVLLEDAVRAVDLRPGDGKAAIAQMVAKGAARTRLEQVMA